MLFACGAVLLAGCRGEGRAARRGCPGSTLVCTLGDPRGVGELQPQAAESLINRTDLAPAARVVKSLATFAQISDIHITDEESPLRVEVIDPLGQRVSSAFRPQESLTTQVLAATEVSVNRLKPSFVLISGDVIDNAQRNELGWALAVLHGGPVRPDSGAPGYQGVQTETATDPLLYRPDIDPPRHPGLLGDAQRTFVAPGLHARWFPLVSNHDLLVQGLVPADEQQRRIATGARKVTAPSSESVALARRGRLDRPALEHLLDQKQAGTTIRVAPDRARSPMSPEESVRRLAAAAQLKSGASLLGSGLLAYARRVAPRVELIALDTVDRAGGATGVLPPRELSWLAAELARHAHQHLLIASPTPLEDTRGGLAALALLDRTPGVVAVLSGDTHRSLITPRRTPAGGYWLVRAPSLVDYPEQARAFRLVALSDDRVALETWMLDHAGDPARGGYLGLAGTSRELAFLDFQGGRPRRLEGSRADRNVRLFLPR